MGAKFLVIFVEPYASSGNIDGDIQLDEYS